jgi:hypothetical protein
MTKLNMGSLGMLLRVLTRGSVVYWGFLTLSFVCICHVHASCMAGTARPLLRCRQRQIGNRVPVIDVLMLISDPGGKKTQGIEVNSLILRSFNFTVLDKMSK